MVLLSGAPALKELDWYTFEGLADDQYDPNDNRAYVTFSIPLASLEGAPRGAFQQMMKDWLELLRPVHAYGGFSTIFPIDEWEAQKLTYPLVMRFPGLDHDAPIWFWGKTLDQGIKGAHWLVYLNPVHIATVGGLETLTAELGEGFRIDPVAGGVLIQAGPTPQLGDRNQNLRPQYYERLGKILAPIRVVISTNGYLDPEGEDPMLKTQDWLARFD